MSLTRLWRFLKTMTLSNLFANKVVVLSRMLTGTSQGCGRGRGRGRNGGRGCVNRRTEGQGATRNQEKKFYSHSSGKYKQTFTFQSVKEDIEQKIQRTFIEGLDIVISLQKRGIH